MKLWTTLCTLVCLLIGGGTVNAGEWTFTGKVITQTVNGVLQEIPVGNPKGNELWMQFTLMGPCEYTTIDLSGTIKDDDGNEYMITQIMTSFLGCTKLTDLTIPASVTSISTSFSSAPLLTKITYLGATEPMLESAFANGPKERILYVPNAAPDAKFNLTKWGAKVMEQSPAWTYDSSAETITHRDNGLVINVTNADSKLTVTGINSGEPGEPTDIELTGRIADSNKNLYTITAIGANAFSNKAFLVNMVLTEQVVSIGEGAFSGCANMTGIIIYPGVTEIGKDAFSGCEKLASATIPAGLTTIGEGAFRKTAIAGSLSLPNSLTSIGKEAYQECKEITQVIMPNTLTVFPESLFDKCAKLARISLGAVTSIGDYCFRQTALTSADLSAVTTIGKSAFDACASLEKITLNPNTSAIAESVFNGCSKLVSITCPTTDEPTLGADAFLNGRLPDERSTPSWLSLETGMPAISGERLWK